MNSLGIVLMVAIAIVIGSMIALQMKAFEDIIKLPNNATWSYVAGEEGQTIVTGFNQTYVIRPSSRPSGSGNGPFYAAQSGETRNGTVNATGEDREKISSAGSGNLSILVTKVGSEAAHVGDTIAYTITVTNNGDIVLDNVWINDTVIGFSQNILSLEPNASNTFNPNYTVDSSILDPFLNTAVAQGTNDTSEVISSASWSLDILHPNISVTMSATPKVRGGDIIYIAANVTNIGDTNLSMRVTGDKVNLTGPPVLGLGERGTYNGSYVAPPGNESIIFTVTAVGVDQLGKEVTASASSATEIFNPGINVTKVGPGFAHVGDTITYTINVTNNGDTALDVWVNDTAIGFRQNIPSLEPNTSNTYNPNYTLNSSPDPFVNTVVAEGTNGTLVNSSASWSVDILHPNISVAMSITPKVRGGDTIYIAVNVTNTGDTDLSMSVTGDKVNLTGPPVLGLGERGTYNGSYVAPPENESINFTVTAVGVDQLGKEVTASASATTVIPQPEWDFTITPDRIAAHDNEIINYTLWVNNTGNTTLFNATVNYTLSVVPGSENLIKSVNLGTIQPGDSIRIIEPFNVSVAPDFGNATINASATVYDGVGPLYKNVLKQVPVIHPRIEIKLGALELTNEGGNINYREAKVAHIGKFLKITYTLYNTGDTLLDPAVYDSIKGRIPSNGLLPPLSIGGNLTFIPYGYNICWAPYPFNDEVCEKNVIDGWFNDSAYAIGRDMTGKIINSANSSFSLPLTPISRIKIADRYTAQPGQDITYTLKINSSTNLTSVTIRDQMLNVTYTRDIFVKGEEILGTVAYTVKENDSVIGNIATINARIEGGAEFEDSDYWIVIVPNGTPPSVSIKPVSSPSSRNSVSDSYISRRKVIATGEEDSNVESREVREQDVLAFQPATYLFRYVDPIIWVAFTSNSSDYVPVLVEVLKNKSTLLKSAPVPPGEAYKHFNILADSWGYNKNILKGGIGFRVKNDWLVNKSYAPEDVSLYQWENNGWVNKSVRITDSNSNYTYYAGIVSGFGFFAITAQKPPPPPQGPKAKPSKVREIKVTPTPQVNQSKQGTTAMPTVNWVLISGVVIAIAFGALMVFFLPRHKNK